MKIMSECSHQLHLVLLSLLFCITTAVELSSAAEAANIRCIERERQGLLMFKQGLVDDCGHLSSWGSEEDRKDCCKWRGVHCSKRTGHIIRLDLSRAYFECPDYQRLRGNITSSILVLQHLNYLDLSFNDFGGNQIPEFIGSLTKLSFLGLADANFNGRIPPQLGNLTNLEHLDLSSNNFGGSHIPEYVGSLTKLQFIDLSAANFSGRVPYQLGNLTDLYYLDIGDNDWYVDKPEWLSRPYGLGFLGLSSCDLTNSAYHWLSNNSSKLYHLDLSGNQLQGHIPDNAFRNMTSLRYLDLSFNQISGISKSCRDICRLEELNLYENNLGGQLSELFHNLSGCTSKTLETLWLDWNMLGGSLTDITGFPSLRNLLISYNRLDGYFSEKFLQLSPLEELYLEGNNLRGPLPDFSVFPLLRVLYIGENRLNGTVSERLGQLSQLETLSLFSNSFEGMITEAHMSNLSKLKYMDFSCNSLALNFSPGWFPPFQLEYIGLQSCKLGPKFPDWLQSQTNYSVLDISDAGISDTVPTWFWDLSPHLSHLNLSNNHMKGMLPDLSSKFVGYVEVIDLSSNNFHGLIPLMPPNVRSVLFSKNEFSGAISFLCDIKSKYFSELDLSENQLSGEIPHCSEHWQKLNVLNLANNNFSGKVPNTMDTSCSIQSLHLRNNSFTGELPSSMKNCKQLRVIDLGDNKFFGIIPKWIGDNLSNLAVLSLRFNRFHGPMPEQLCNLAKVQILDFSRNYISGNIPKCLSNLSVMAQTESSNAVIGYHYGYTSTSFRTPNFAEAYEDHAFLIWKGKLSKYGSILGLVKSIDLSSNKLTGEIPDDLVGLVGLISLNISRNNLAGPIPANIGKLNLLNSLDLSKNMLSGEIPESLSQISLLGVLDVSNNNLSGKIPSGTQLQSFDASAYMGNADLCGLPLPNKCLEEELAPGPAIEVQSEDRFITQGFYVSLVLGFITGFWGVCGTLLLNRSWTNAYFSILSNIKEKLYVWMAVSVINLKQWLRS